MAFDINGFRHYWHQLSEKYPLTSEAAATHHGGNPDLPMAAAISTPRRRRGALPPPSPPHSGRVGGERSGGRLSLDANDIKGGDTGWTIKGGRRCVMLRSSRSLTRRATC